MVASGTPTVPETAPNPQMEVCELVRILAGAQHFIGRLTAVADLTFGAELSHPDGDSQLRVDLAFSSASIHSVSDQLRTLMAEFTTHTPTPKDLRRTAELLQLCRPKILADSRDAELDEFSKGAMKLLLQDIELAIAACAGENILPCNHGESSSRPVLFISPWIMVAVLIVFILFLLGVSEAFKWIRQLFA